MPVTENEAQLLSGLIISYFGSSVAVLAEDGQVFQCHLRRNQELPVVGDEVRFILGHDDTGTISEIAPRRSMFARGNAQGKMKAIAANVDLIVIVMSPPPVFSEYLIDRYLIAAQLLSIPAMLVLNKMDLLLDEAALTAVRERLAIYKAFSCPVALSSVYAKDGLSDLAAALSQHSAVLVGPSGVGKSSIIAALGEDPSIRVQDVSPKGAGKHTTTATRLYRLPAGGSLIDSPGVREFNLWPINAQDVIKGFAEFKNYSGDCKFRDCSHLVEPSCAVQEAVATGKISASRMESYRELMKLTKK